MQLDVAAYGWLDEGWAPSYPDDLPLDWRIDYYANEFRSLVVPNGHWATQADDVLLTWLEEAHETFSFYWELASHADARRLVSLYRSSADLPQPGGWLLLPGWRSDSSVELELSSLAPVAQCDRVGMCHGGIRVHTVEEGADLRQLRHRLDEYKASGDEPLLLVVMPSPGAATSLDQMQILCQLYGG